MKDRNQRFTPKPLYTAKKELFPLIPILINIIAIIVLIGAYYFVMQGNLFPEYQTYIYWTMNVLVTYNVLAASARSFIAPILTIIIGALALVAFYNYSINILTFAQNWQILIVGVIGFFITCALRL